MEIDGILTKAQHKYTQSKTTMAFVHPRLAQPELFRLVSCIMEEPDVDAAAAVKRFTGDINAVALCLGDTPLYAAIKSKKLRTIAALGARGDVDPNAQGYFGDLALHAVCNTAVGLPSRYAAKLVISLLDAFPMMNLDGQGYWNYTALMRLAGYAGVPEKAALVAKILLERGANPDIRSNGRHPTTALETAVKYKNKAVVLVLNEHVWAQSERATWLSVVVASSFPVFKRAKHGK